MKKEELNKLLDFYLNPLIIHYIKYNNSLPAIQHLLHLGIDINALSSSGETALHLLLKCKKLDKERILFFLENGARLDLGMCYYSISRVAKTTLPFSYTVTTYKKFTLAANGNTVLHYALRNPNITPEIIKLLLDYNAPVAMKDSNGATPLEVAINNPNRNNKILALLIKHGAEVDSRIMEVASRRYRLLHSTLKLLIKSLAQQGTENSLNKKHREHYLNVLEQALFQYLQNNPFPRLDIVKYFLIRKKVFNINLYINEKNNLKKDLSNVDRKNIYYLLHFASHNPHMNIEILRFLVAKLPTLKNSLWEDCQNKIFAQLLIEKNVNPNNSKLLERLNFKDENFSNEKYHLIKYLYAQGIERHEIDWVGSKRKIKKYSKLTHAAMNRELGKFFFNKKPVEENISCVKDPFIFRKQMLTLFLCVKRKIAFEDISTKAKQSIKRKITIEVLQAEIDDNYKKFNV